MLTSEDENDRAGVEASLIGGRNEGGTYGRGRALLPPLDCPGCLKLWGIMGGAGAA